MDQSRKQLQTSRSFTRLDTVPAQNPLSRSRATTLQGPPVPPVPEILFPHNVVLSPRDETGTTAADIFAATEDGDDEEDVGEFTVPDSFEDLPIEIRSLTER